jgi:hypothetical protein
MTTDLNVEGGMHIESDPKTGAIAASQVTEDGPKPKDDQPEQTPKAEAEQRQEPVNPRKDIMAKIYANRADSFQKELEYAAAVSMGATVDPILDESSPISEERQGEQITETKQPENKAVTKAESSVTEPETKPTKKYIISGQQVELTEDQLTELASRTVNAEQRLQQVPQQIYQQPQYQQQVQPIQPQRQANQPPEVDNRLKDIARKITYGNEEESTRALGDLVGLTASLVQRPQGPTPDQIVQAAVNQTTANLEFKRNLDTIASEYKDVFEKRSLTLVAADKVNSLRNSYALIGIQKPDVDLYREACNSTREEFGLKSSTAPQIGETKTVATPNLQNKMERKRAAPQPAASAHKVSQAPAANSALTGSDIVARMRKSRGQAAL